MADKQKSLVKKADKQKSLVKKAYICLIKGFLSYDDATEMKQLLNDDDKFKNTREYHFDEEKDEVYSPPAKNSRGSYWLGAYAQSKQSTNMKATNKKGKIVNIPCDFAYPYTTPKKVKEMQDKIQELYYFKKEFNGILIVRFDNPSQKIGFHSDSSNAMGPDPEIASVSLGRSRLFRIKSKEKDENGEREKVDIILEHGDLLIMKNGANEHYLHQVNKDPGCTPEDPRLNLTLRCYEHDDVEKQIVAKQF
jgi:alkylated DNA repair dioxygenase AlkB